APPSAPATQTIVIDGTLETAPAYLTVHVPIWDGDQVLQGKATGQAALQGPENIDDIDELLDGTGNAEPTEEACPDYPDTGASAHVLSAATASNCGMTVLNDAAYHETSLHGQVAMGVTDAYTLALSGSSGMLFDKPGQFG